MRQRRLVIVVIVVLAMVAAAYGVGALIAGLSSKSQGAGEPAPAAPPVPEVARAAYAQAAETVAAERPDCAGLTWSLLAGVGAVESRHGSGRSIAADGEVSPAIYGPRLDGSGVGGNTTPVTDTDGGSLDADPDFDRAVGPMQFLPGTWAEAGRDGNGDGVADPQNYFDATLSAALYLCGDAASDLSDPTQLAAAITRYNNSSSYVAQVVDYARVYAGSS